ncbi:MAG: DUF4982 domain-containing protein [Clostridia bacterium]|nr:DUF4982 domain-containing protein [Clostridia bacterium]
MQKLSLNTAWRYAHLGHDDWQDITLPHDAMLSEPRTATSPGGTNIGWFAAEDYEYVRELDVPGDHAYLAFEGVYHRAEVFVDGKREAAHPNGYFPFTVPVEPGHHTLRVIAHNQDQPNSRWYTGAGIYRPVSLVCLPEKHILPESVAVRTLDAENREISVTFTTSTPGRVRADILDGENTLASKEGEGELRFMLPEARLWSPEDPALYTLRLTFHDDVQTVRFGIRTIACDAKRGLLINGERVILRGACIHHDNGLLGAVAHPFAERRKVALLKKAGYNAIRSAHNPCSEALLTACDELGMLVMDEYVDMWYIHKTQFDYAGYVEKNWKDDLKRIVIKDRNHPSVILYSLGNEVSETAQDKGIALARAMQDELHALDDRPVTCGVNIFFNFLSSMGFGVYSDDKAKKNAENAKKEGSKARKKAVGSEFINNVAGLLGAGFMKFGATLHGSDVKTRGIYAVTDVAGYNYGINRYLKDLNKYPDRVILGSETFASDAVAFMDIAREHPAIIGDFVWTGMDHLGETGIGAWEYAAYAPDFSHGPGWITSGAGTIDLTGRETGQMAYTQVAFGLSKVRIAVVPVPFAREKHSPAAWRMTNALESWSWGEHEGKMTTVEVYARGASAVLLLNGKVIGRKQIPKDARTLFDVTYAPGTLTAVIYDGDGKEIARTSLVSAQLPSQLRLVPEKAEVHPGELIYVRVQLTDTEGVLRPDLMDTIALNVSGGKLLSFGNACSYNARGYLTDRSDTYYGEALAIIEPQGPVDLTATGRTGKATCHIDWKA